MSLFSDLLLFGGSILGNNAQVDTTNKLAQVQQNQQNFEKDVIQSGQIDPYGNVINRRDPTTGAFKTTLAPGSQTLADQTLENNVNAEQRREGFGDISGDLMNQFRGTQIDGPVSRSDANNIVNLDNQRQFNSVIEPLTNKIALQTQRTMGNTSNAPQYAANATKEILPAIQIGGEKDAINLANADMDRFIRQTLQLSEGLNNASTGGKIELPGVANSGQVSNMLNAVGTPSVVPVNNNAALFSGLSSAGQLLNSREAQANSNNQFNKLLDVLAQRQLGNQGGTV